MFEQVDKCEILGFPKMKLYTECMNKEEKLKKVKDLYKQVNDYFIKEYLDLESMENLDMKIEVLGALLAGKKPYEIEHYDDVLDKYPKKEEFVQGNIQDLLDRL